MGQVRRLSDYKRENGQLRSRVAELEAARDNEGGSSVVLLVVGFSAGFFGGFLVFAVRVFG